MRRVLVVDDDLCIRKGLRIRLEGAGYEVATSGNGTEAIMIFDENGADLLVLDVRMPDIDGFEVCRSVKQNSDVPVIFLTGAQNQMYHAVALLGVAWAAGRWPGPLLRWSEYLFIVGVVVFSGSLYALSVTNIRGLGRSRRLGAWRFWPAGSAWALELGEKRAILKRRGALGW